MVCSRCGKESNGKYCPRCGVELKEDIFASENILLREHKQSKVKPTDERGKIIKGIIGASLSASAGALLLIVIFGVKEFMGLAMVTVLLILPMSIVGIVFGTLSRKYVFKIPTILTSILVIIIAVLLLSIGYESALLGAI